MKHNKRMAALVAVALGAMLAIPALAQFEDGQGGPPPPGPGAQPPQGGQFGPPQGGRMGGPGMGMAGGPMILMRSDVQKELKITEEQKKKLAEVVRMGGGRPPMGQGGPGGGPGGPGGQGGFPPAAGGALGGYPPQGGPPPPGGFGGGQGGPPPPGGFGGGQGGPPPQGGQGGQRGQRGQGGQPGQPGPGGFGGPGGPGGFNPEEQQKREQEMDKKIKAILDDGQYKRYHQLLLQQQGPGSILRKDVALELDLRESQRQKIEEIQRSMFESMRPDPNGERPDPAEMRAKIEKARKETGEKILAVLTSDQRSKWQSMLGKEFKFDPNIRPNMPGGPGGPGGRGGPGGGPGGPPPGAPGGGGSGGGGGEGVQG